MELAQGDLFDSSQKELSTLCADIEVCIHCAWYVRPGEYLFARQNIDCLWGSIRLFDALGKAGCRQIVGIGTCLEHDCSYGYLSESSPTKGTSLYSAAKHSAFLVGEQLAATHAMGFAWARLFYLYGPHEHSTRLIPYVIRSLLRGEKANVTSGHQIRDYLHVEDAASAIIAVMEHRCSGPVNIGSDFPVTVREIVFLLAEMLNKPDLASCGARPSNVAEPPFICANNSKLRSETDWEPCYDLKTGLLHTIEWWKANLKSNYQR
jgi:nucleoside-diphosphate-sugar epimerase